LDPRSTVVHLLLGARYRPFGGAFELGGGFGPDLGQAAGSASYRLLASVGFSPEAPPPPPDRDSDSVPDATDICLNLPGVPSRDPMMHGCPEVPLDTDGDSVPDSFDACPRVPGEVTAARGTNGCPKPIDRDADGIADPQDACPAEPGVVSIDPKLNGCKAPPPAATLGEQRIGISQQVEFETGTSVLRPESDAILREVMRVLVEHPELVRVEIQGHTDDRGTREFNQRLSEERARSVMSWLVARGIAETRLMAKGYGQDQPLAENATEAGRALNRRVEFRVLETAAKGSKP
jgi:outer membrane protein OmpA-like peptidoglycan-associated protein